MIRRNDIKMTKKRLLLVGGGHAHLHLLERFHKIKLEGIEPILVSEHDIHYYSGMASGYVENIYTKEQASFDLAGMCERYGIEFIKETVTAIDPVNRKVRLRSGNEISFDILSLDTGSGLVGENIPCVKENAVFVKPLNNLRIIKERVEKIYSSSFRIVVVGAGAAGIEISLALRAGMKREGKFAKIVIVERKNEILQGYDKKIVKAIWKKLAVNDIGMIVGEKIEAADKGRIFLTLGKEQAYDILVWATGPSANPMYKEAGLKTDKSGFVLVNKYLQALDYPYIFGAGDCVSFFDYDYVKKAGVYAVREAPYLYNNIVCFVENKQLIPYVPQKDYLSIISTGNRTGVMSLSGLVLSGRVPWMLKDKIDKRFVKKYKDTVTL
jgi:NADH dehydrogenase FAD-containing subunit